MPEQASSGSAKTILPEIPSNGTEPKASSALSKISVVRFDGDIMTTSAVAICTSVIVVVVVVKYGISDRMKTVVMENWVASRFLRILVVMMRLMVMVMVMLMMNELLVLLLRYLLYHLVDNNIPNSLPVQIVVPIQH